MKKARIFKGVRAISFLLVFFLAFHCITSILVNPDPNEGHRIFHWIHDFHDEPKNSLDAIFIGSSVVHANWLSPVAYKKYGITVWPYCVPGLRFSLAESIIQTIKNNHKDALFIISTNGIWDGIDKGAMHGFVDYLPRTPGNISLIVDSCRIADYPASEFPEFIFPIIQFHTRWTDLIGEDFHYENDGLKGGTNYYAFLNRVYDVTDMFSNTEKRAEISPRMISVVNSLLDFCSQDPEKYLFVTSPWFNDKELEAQVNTVNDMIRARGFPVVNVLDYLEETGLDPQTDYSDANHTNIHGALKFTDFLSQYLVAHYDFPEKSSGGGYESWNAAYDTYKQIITPYLTEEELEQLP